MSHGRESNLLQAADQLGAVLNRGAALYLQILSASDGPRIKAALGFGQQPEGSQKITCLLEEHAQTRNEKGLIDFPVLADKGLVKSVKIFYTDAFVSQHDSVPDPTENCAAQCSRFTDSLENSPHVTRAILAHKSPAFVALSWLCNPQLDCFISFRRRWLRDSFCAAEDQAPANTKLHLILEEVVLLDLLLSVCPKLKSLWEYRLWVVNQMFKQCSPYWLGKNRISTDLLCSRFQQQDDVSFFMAAHNHPMNYNAWHYRRCIEEACYLPTTVLKDSSDVAERVIRYDCEKVVAFIREHNGDSSATSYLLFLLNMQDKRDSLRAVQVLKTDLETPLGDTELLFPLTSTALTKREDRDSISDLWKYLMCCTQKEIRRHCEKGHDCMWYLRLELVRWALSERSQVHLCSSWTVLDELEWVCAFVDATSSSSCDKLLSPVSALPHAWTESSGSLEWTSYNAARYGLQLLSVLQCLS